MSQVKLNREQAASRACTHISLAKAFAMPKRECPECVALGDTWVHLRMCMICGHVGCCDSSKNKHATAHFKKTGHPIIKSLELGEDWAWCYVDDTFLE